MIVATGFSVFVNIGGKLNQSLSSAVRGAEAQITGLGRRVSATNAKMSAAMANAGRRLQQTGQRVTATVSTPTALLAFGAGKMAFEFEKAGNLLEALGDASEKQRAQFEGLANELNKKYPQTLAEIIRTGNEMLKGGFDFDQMRGAIDQTLATAVLGDMTPSEVGNMMARTINSFQMPMKTYEDAMRSSVQVSDRMTYAAVKTTASLKDMGEMYRYVGGAMSASGGTLDQATAFAMAFAKNGTVGSEAGVALRSAIVRMVKMPSKGHAALARAGLNLKDFLGESKPVTADSFLAGLQAGGIDASGSKKQIEGILKNKKLAGNHAKLTAELTKVVQSSLGSNSAVDASTIADNVNQSLVIAGNKVDLMGFFRALKQKIDSGQMSQGELATILEGRHFARYAALFQNDLDALVKQIETESNGYTQARYGTVLKGIVGPVYELSAAFEKLSTVFGRIVFPDLAKLFGSMAEGMQRISSEQPGFMRFVAYSSLAAIALGPLVLAAGATVRVLGLVATGLLAVGNAATVGLATRLVMVAGAIRSVAVAAALGAAGRLRAMAAGLIALGAVGGGRAVLSALAGGLLSMGRAVLMFPLVALRAVAVAMWGLVANPVGIAITAIVTALAALGVWVANNWEGIKTFFESFGRVFMASIGPSAAGFVGNVVTKIGELWNWISRLLGPIDATGEKWHEWGGAAGRAVAAVVNAVVELPGKIAAAAGEFAVAMGNLAKRGWDAVVNFDWAGLGRTIVQAIIDGVASMGSALANKLGSMASEAWSGVKSKLGFGGAAADAGKPSALEARARGGPVSAGKTYLVGEKGPELFRAPASGEIVPNDKLRSLSSPDRIAQATGSGGPSQRSVTYSPTFQISGVTDPHEVARIAERKFTEMVRRGEYEQHGLLSD